jgi:hypothetical protein
MAMSNMPRNLASIALMGVIICIVELAQARELDTPATIKLGKLELVSVEVFSQQDIATEEKYWDEGAISQPLFRVTFAATRDLQQLATDDGYNIDNVASICRGVSIDENRPLKGFPSVFDERGIIDTYRRRTEHSLLDKQRGRGFRYHVYFAVRQSGISGFFSYDLGRKPDSVCLAVRGVVDYPGAKPGTLSSSVLIVPREMIVQALIRAGLH